MSDAQSSRFARAAWLAALAVVALALLLRALGSMSSLPFTYDPDEPDFINRAVQMLVTGDLNPRWFGHPGSVTMYSFALTYAGYAAGWGHSLGELEALFRVEPSVFYALARSVVVAFGAATVALAWLLARRIVGPWYALFAAALLAVAPLHIEFSRYARPDVQMTFLVLASLWFALSILERSRWRDYLAAGFLLGLATVTKYPALVFALAIVLAHALRLFDTQLAPWRDLDKLVGAGVAALAGAFAGSPWLFLSLPSALGDIAREARSYHLGATSTGFLDSLGWYAGGPVLGELGMLGLVLAAAGAITTMATAARRAVGPLDGSANSRGGQLLAVAALCFMAFISALSLRWARWILPVVPLLCVLAAVGLRELVTLVPRTLPRPVVYGAALAVALAAVALPALVSVPWTQAAARGDTRDAAFDWLMENAPEGSAILGESYTPQLPPDRYRLYMVSESRIWRLETEGRRYAVPRGVIGTLFDSSDIRRARIDFVVISNHYDRRLEEPERYARQIGIYDSVRADGELVFEALPGPGRAVGVPVRVYRLSRQ